MSLIEIVTKDTEGNEPTEADKALLRSSSYKDFFIEKTSGDYLSTEVVFNKNLSFDLSELFVVDVSTKRINNLEVAVIDSMYLDDSLRSLGIGYKVFKAILVQFGAIYDLKKNMSRHGEEMFKKLSREPSVSSLGVDDSSLKYILLTWSP